MYMIPLLFPVSFLKRNTAHAMFSQRVMLCKSPDLIDKKWSEPCD
jgi:hypothetical protein